MRKEIVFNWKFYVNKYKDLQKANINTYDKAYNHWIKYGKNEGRICSINSFSQFNQDLLVLDFYNFKRNGYFVEIGAYDGVSISNCLLLEKEYDWIGICIEPIPFRFEKLKENRKKSICINKAVFHTSDLDILFSVANIFDALSGISDYIDCHNAVVDQDKTVINVKTITLNDVLDQNNAPEFIDYLSLDTEGTEFEIIKSVNLQKYIFGYIHIEHNLIEPRRTNMKDFLISHGYKYIGENHVDDIYIYDH